MRGKRGERRQDHPFPAPHYPPISSTRAGRARQHNPRQLPEPFMKKTNAQSSFHRIITVAARLLILGTLGSITGCNTVPNTINLSLVGDTRYPAYPIDRPVPIYIAIDISDKIRTDAGQPLLPAADLPPNASIGLIKIATNTDHEATFKQAQEAARKLGADAIIVTYVGFDTSIKPCFESASTGVSFSYEKAVPNRFYWTFNAIRFSRSGMPAHP
jgi:hypothetical protein